MLDVSSESLRQAYRIHLSCLKSCRNPGHPSLDLIRFYAAECGLKYLWLKEKGLHNTLDMTKPDRKRVLTHDLPKIAELLAIPADEVPEGPNFYAATFTERDQIYFKDTHEAMRYGVVFKPNPSTGIDSRKDLIDWLDKVLKWTKSQIR